MKSDCFKYLLVHWFWVQVFCFVLTNADFDEDMWMDPDAWTRQQIVTGSSQSTNGKCCRCVDSQVNPATTDQPLQEFKQTTAEDVASSIYFKKFVTTLFNRKNFKYDASQKRYERSVRFVINSYQMDKLEQLQDPRDLDIILIEVFNNMDTTSQKVLRMRETSTAIKTIVLNLLCDMLQLIKTSEMRFLLVVMCVIMVAWLINKRLKISWLLLVSGGVLIYGYFHTYIECNRELEIKEMMEKLYSGTEHENNIQASKILNFFKRLFNSDDIKTRQQQKLSRELPIYIISKSNWPARSPDLSALDYFLKREQSAKLSLGFCRPDHVFLIYFNDIFLKYLQVLIEQSTATMASLNANLGFPYNLFTPFFVILLIGYLVKLTFKYMLSPSAWAQLYHRKQFNHKNERVLENGSNPDDDRISGDNLKLLLNAFNAAPQRNVFPATSGVEDVKEAIESSSDKSLPKADKSTSENFKSNDISNKGHSDGKIDVSIGDLSERS